MNQILSLGNVPSHRNLTENPGFRSGSSCGEGICEIGVGDLDHNSVLTVFPMCLTRKEDAQEVTVSLEAATVLASDTSGI
jgi:hypothetical protein